MLAHDLDCGEMLGGLGLRADSFPAMRRSAAVPAPLSIVAMRMSWPGQSTNDTWRTSFMRLSSKPGTSHIGESGIVEPCAR